MSYYVRSVTDSGESSIGPWASREDARRVAFISVRRRSDEKIWFSSVKPEELEFDRWINQSGDIITVVEK